MTILVALVFHSSWLRKPALRDLLLSLAIAPLVRIFSLSLPLRGLAYVIWFLAAAIPVFIAVICCMWLQKLPVAEVGIVLPSPRSIPLEVGVAIAGFPLGLMEYHILRPMSVLPHLDAPTVVGFVLLLVMCTGFIEELAFRGLMQRNATRAMGQWGVSYVAVLFGVLHLGNVSFADLLFAAGVGLMYGFVVRKTGSILGVSLSHGLSNSVLFVFAPFYLG